MARSVDPATPDAMPATDIDAVLARAYEVHGPLLLSVAHGITGDWHEAQDVVQTAFEIALRHRRDLRDPGAVREWLLRIETREAIRLTRRLRRALSFSGQTADIAGPDQADVIAVRQALTGLPRRERAAVVLHHMVGLSIVETAAALGVSPNTVRTQVRHGKAKVRERLR